MLRALRCLALPATLGALALATACAAPAAAATGDIGYEDQGYAPLTGSPTGSKPEAKLWFNSGWWATMFNGSAGEHRIYKLDSATGRWSDTGVAIDPRDSTRADTLWRQASGKLYVASHVFTTAGTSTTAGNAGRLYRYSYDATSGRYSLDAGFPVTVNQAKTETLVIDRDSTGMLWATWTQNSRVYVNHSVGGNDAAWGTPYIVPGAGTSLTGDDLSSLIHFGPGAGNQIGVMWSNQSDGKFYFAVHPDGANDAAWSSAALSTGASSDDHINLKADSLGRVYAAVKTSEGSSARPLVQLLVRAASGTWTPYTFGTVANSHTRPIVLLFNEPHGEIHMLATGPQPPNTSGQSGGDIVEKVTSMDSPSFSAGVGTAVIRDASSAEMNDATSTKQNLDAASGLVVMANNATTDTYWHMQESLGGSSTGPTAAFTGAPTSGAAPLSVTFTDASTGGPTAWSWSFGDGGTSTQRSPTHVYSAAGTYTVALTVSNGSGSDTQTRTGYITVGGGGGGGGGGQEVLNPVEDVNVKSANPTRNYGTETTLRVRTGTPASPGDYRTLLKFTVPTLTGPVTGATLRLYVTDASPDGGRVYAVASSWSEASVTWDTAPAIGATPVVTLGATPAVGSWAEVSLGSLVTGSGTYSVELVSSSTNSAIYSSREGAHAPELVITTG